ncbi:hypothetical protein [Flavonifractor porci]|uniref:hypothetical protein n=1 Tax=Flavonifractor porci TaxID=3133422 RepID=UPI0030A43DA7
MASILQIVAANFNFAETNCIYHAMNCSLHMGFVDILTLCWKDIPQEKDFYEPRHDFLPLMKKRVVPRECISLTNRTEVIFVPQYSRFVPFSPLSLPALLFQSNATQKVANKKSQQKEIVCQNDFWQTIKNLLPGFF